MIDVAFAARDRVHVQCADLFKAVGTLAEVEALENIARVAPAAYIVPEEVRVIETASGGLDADVQTHQLQFGVLLITRHAGDASGARAADALGPLREAVAAALCGWMPTGCSVQVRFARGELNACAEGTTMWLDHFTVERIVERPIVTI